MDGGKIFAVGSQTNKLRAMSSQKRGAKRHPNRCPFIAIRPATAALILAAAGSRDSRGATVTSTWNSPTGSFNWSDPTHWTNAPAANTYPDNVRLGNTYDVVIGQGAPVLDTSVTVRSLTLSDPAYLSTGVRNSDGTPNAGT